MNDKLYGVICEWKAEAPLIMEGYLATEEEARERMSGLIADKNVIRAAVFAVNFVYGNKSLCEGK